MNILKQIKLYREIKKSIPENPKIDFNFTDNQPIAASKTYTFTHENPEFHIEVAKVFVNGKYFNENYYFAEIINNKKATNTVIIDKVAAELLYALLVDRKLRPSR